MRHGDEPRGHPRHARRGRHPDRARRHDEPRRRRRARHGAAVRVAAPGRCASTPRPARCRSASASSSKGDLITIDGGTGAGARTDAPRCASRSCRAHFATLMGWADAERRARRARQRRYAARRQAGPRLRRRGHRALPHRAHVLRGEPHPRHARDDPRRRRGRPAAGARQDPAHAARGLRGAVRDHGRVAGDDPPARSAAARVPAARGEARRRPLPRSSACPLEKLQARVAELSRVQSDARLPRLPPRASAIPRSPKCRRAPSSRPRSPRARRRASR